MGGRLISEGVDCNTKLLPLCLSLSAEFSNSEIDQLCEECSSTENFSCKKWVNLEDVVTQDISVTGVELCLDPCLPSTENEGNDESFCENLGQNTFLFNLK